MIRKIACCVAALAMTAGTLSAEIYNPAAPGVSSSGSCGCNAGGPRPSFGACQSCPSGTCPSGICQSGPIPGGISFGGNCPTCPSSYSHMGNCPHSGSSCPNSGSCPSCQSSHCSLGWCMKTGLCCLDNPCQMPPHYPYAPVNHGNYYFAPYNYTKLLQQKAYAQMQNQDPRQPYIAGTFASSYKAVIGDREDGDYEESVVQPTKGLPDLEVILGVK
ncbi:MAG: hypothetical protein O2945_13540 [Planctomycetota bacterium]|nr:hypothetical protein [Planctomycetota bacterium]MDA0920089.1 hypothetical protein [Planctomycetota bacterium]